MYTEDDVVVFCTKDKPFHDVLPYYFKAYKKRGSNPEHLESISLLTECVAEYQEKTESKSPDTERDCEIDCCLGGKV